MKQSVSYSLLVFFAIVSVTVIVLCVSFHSRPPVDFSTESSDYNIRQRNVSFRDIPGVTEDEIKAVEVFQE